MEQSLTQNLNNTSTAIASESQGQTPKLSFYQLLLELNQEQRRQRQLAASTK